MDEKNIIVCRCEDLTLTDVRKAIEEGFTSWDELKRRLRIGMGPCGGKTCRLLVLNELRKSQKLSSIDEVRYRPTVIRPVLRSTPFEVFLKEEG
jgi:bacterioferritin-associated ferredoxin